MSTKITDLIDAAGKYVIAFSVIIGCLILVYQGRGDQVQPWTVMGLIVGWIIRDSSGSAATANAVKVANAATTSGGG